MEGEKLVYHPGWVAKVIQVRPVCCRPLTPTHIPHGKCDCSAVCAARHAGWLQLSDFMRPSIPVPKLFSCTRRRWSGTASCWWDPPEAARPRSSAACARPSTRRWASRTRTAASTPRPSARRRCTEKWIPAPENGTQVCIAQLVFLSILACRFRFSHTLLASFSRLIRKPCTIVLHDEERIPSPTRKESSRKPWGGKYNFRAGGRLVGIPGSCAAIACRMRRQRRSVHTSRPTGTKEKWAT